jgi:hypothetical protein
MDGAPETPTWRSRSGVKVGDGRWCRVPHTLARNMFDEMATTMCGSNVTKFEVRGHCIHRYRLDKHNLHRARLCLAMLTNTNTCTIWAGLEVARPLLASQAD